MGGMEHVRVLLPARPKHDAPLPEELHTLSQTLLQQSNTLQGIEGATSRQDCLTKGFNRVISEKHSIPCQKKATCGKIVLKLDNQSSKRMCPSFSDSPNLLVVVLPPYTIRPCNCTLLVKLFCRQ